MPRWSQNKRVERLDNLPELTHSLDDIEAMINEEIVKQQNEEHKTHHSYLLYVTLGLFLFSLILIFVLYITIKCRLTTWEPFSGNPRGSRVIYNEGSSIVELQELNIPHSRAHSPERGSNHSTKHSPKKGSTLNNQHYSPEVKFRMPK